MLFCSQCSKPITGQYFYSAEKNDDKKFCSSNCMNEYYGRKCEECGKIQNALMEKNGKKFCSSTCMDKYFGRESREQISDFWQKYKGWIIGGIAILVLLIILWIVWPSPSYKKKRRY